MIPFRSILHSLRRAPVFTAVALATLAFGIGLNTTMASLLEALLFRPAPFAEAQQLYRVEGLTPDGTDTGLSVPELDAIESGLGDFAAGTSFRWIDAALTEPDAPAENFIAVATTGTFFERFGVAALHGRIYRPEDVATPDAPLTVLSHEMWLRRFGGDPAIVGRTIRLNARPVTVLGVMPPSFTYRLLFGYADLWMPGTFRQDGRTNFEARPYALILRLREGASADELRSRLAAVGQRFAADHPGTNARRSFRAVTLRHSTVSPTLRRLSYLITGVSVVVLLIICANLASLQLSRALDRRHEQAVRAALGASPGRLLVRQLGESLVLGAVGAALGLLLAWWAGGLLSRHLEIGNGGKLDLQLNRPVLLLTLAITLVASLAAGAAPALLAARTDVNGALKGQSRGNTLSPAQRRLRSGLIVFEIALALTLLAGAGVLFHGIESFLRRPSGWRTDDVVFATITLPRIGYESRDARRGFQQRLLQELRAEPNVTHAGLSSLPPMYSYWTTRNYLPEGRTAGTDAFIAFYVPSSPSYLDTVGIEVLAGTAFRENVTAEDPPAVVINESLARFLHPNRSAVGQRLLDATGRTAMEIIGVVRDIGFPANVDQPLTPYHVYHPFVQDPWPYITISVRGAGGYTALAAALRHAVARLDPNVPVRDIVNADIFVERHHRNVQLLLRALGVFALAGLVLAAVGVYGVVAHTVAQRRSEFGIRLALGASPRAIAALVVGHGGRLAALGIALGIAGSFGIARALTHALPKVTDPSFLLLAALGAVMGLVTLLASWLPARRAARIDPLVALRRE